jgi:hypothetical protein
MGGAVPALPLKSVQQRQHLVTIVAGLRTSLRRSLAADCAARDSAICTNPLVVHGCHDKETGHVITSKAQCQGAAMDNMVMNSYADSVFCLQPAGDTPTRKGLFDSVMAGCIPVLFDFNMLRTYSIVAPEVSEQIRDWAVLFSKEEVAQFESSQHTASAIDALVKLKAAPKKIAKLQAGVMRVAGSLSYASMECRVPVLDAFTLQLGRLVERAGKCMQAAASASSP